MELSNSKLKSRETEARSLPKWLEKLVSWEVIAPILVGVLVLAIWEGAVRIFEIAPYLLPSPLNIFKTAIAEWGTLFPSLMVTLAITGVAFVLAAVSGFLVAVLFVQSEWIERSLFPYAVILQTTPIVAIAPLIIIWTRHWFSSEYSTFAALVICAWIVAFFPIVSNTTLGLKSIDRNLKEMFQLYQASRWQMLLYLRLPSALPYFLGGLKISGGLALIGAVVAEFVAGTGGAKSGIAYQILMASYNLQIPKMFAALALTTLLGVGIFVLLTAFSNWILKSWHDSAVKVDN